MQLPEQEKRALPADWLRKAEDDVQTAEVLMVNG